jgi:hypothetical protein
LSYPPPPPGGYHHAGKPAPAPKRPFWKSWQGITLLALLAMAVLCCPITVVFIANSDPLPDAAAKDGGRTAAPRSSAREVVTKPGGQAIAVQDGPAQAEVTVSGLNLNAASDNQFNKARRGQFVTIQVVVAAVKGASDVGPSNFRIVGADGTVTKAEIFDTAGFGGKLAVSTTIQEGQRKEGLVVFDCDPAKLATVKIEFSDDQGHPQAYWTF